MALIFLFIYTEILGNGTLSEDAGVFMRESKMLQNVFWQSPSSYLKFMTGFGDTKSLIETYLAETTHWDAGAQSLINDNKNILRVHSLIHFFSLGSPVIHALICCLVGLIGIKQLYIAVRPMMQVRKEIIFWSLLLLPSLFFWSSSILKEPFMLLGFGLFVRSLFHDDSLQKRILFGCIGGALLLGFKPYVMFTFVPVLLFFATIKWLPKFKVLGGFLILAVITSLALTLFSKPREKVIKTISRKQYDFVQVGRGGLHAYSDSVFYYFRPDQMASLNRDHDTFWLKHEMDAQIMLLGQIPEPIPVHLDDKEQRWTKYFENTQSNGFIEITLIDNSYLQLFKNIPEALYNSLFRPMPGDPGGAFNWVAILETFGLFGILIVAITRRKKLTEQEKVRIAGLVLFAVLLSLIIGWTTPVLGAIVRYRIPVYVAILIIAGILYKHKSKSLKHE